MKMRWGYLLQSLRRLLGARGVAVTIASLIYFTLGLRGSFFDFLSISDGDPALNVVNLGLNLLQIVAGFWLWRSLLIGGWLAIFLSFVRVFFAPFEVLPLIVFGYFSIGMTVLALIVATGLLPLAFVMKGWKKLK